MTSNNIKFLPVSFSDGGGGPRTLVPNGPLIQSYRKALGLTGEEFEFRSHRVVEEQAQKAGSDPRYRIRYKKRKAKKGLPGISVSTIRNAEKSEPVYVFTLKIIAEVLGVPMWILIAEQGRLWEQVPAADQQQLAETLAAAIGRLLEAGGTPPSAKALADVVRQVLDEFCRPQ